MYASPGLNGNSVSETSSPSFPAFVHPFHPSPGPFIQTMDVPGSETRRVEANGFSFNVHYKPARNEEGTIVCQHGIGSSSYTFALFLRDLYELNPDLGFLAYDVRHHGYTEELNESSIKGKITDLDLEILEKDFDAILSSTFSPSTGDGDKIPLMLVGHSMGGTLMAKYANQRDHPQYDIRGLVVIDAVEGYARQSLSQMHNLLRMWPDSFSSIEDAVNWHLRRGNLLRNKESAEISVPPLLQKDSHTSRYQWKLDLRRTDSNWDSWFENLDDYFISAPTARLLMLAGMGRLDTSLTRAQMQGKFQLMLVNEAGHYIQEDSPQKVAFAISDFWARNGKPIKIIPKFGQLRTD